MIKDFETFFEHTEGWMAEISKVEYGDPETQGDMLRALSPIHKANRAVAPTLVLHGSHDTLIHPSGGRRTAALIPDATYIELEGLGHDLPAAFWPTVADHVRALADRA